ncbi:MAG: hypothetical protein KatS3mg085_643 [Candidatus Dojkabacteria bacterium]|nr:MAG: hypothetical protein KatS3mg085_643 [Candidatus Dojkabacteria bacterium]
MKSNMNTKIFLDSGDPNVTRELLDRKIKLDGQTTNPSLVASNPKAKLLKKGQKLTSRDLINFYKEIVQEIDEILPGKPISVEVYADLKTKANEMVEQGVNMSHWARNVHIKVPANLEGLKAARELVSMGIKVNITLVFSLEQAYGVALVTKHAKRGDVFISPFVGRLDDKGLDGVDLVLKIKKLYQINQISNVLILASSIRNLQVFNFFLNQKMDLITAPKDIIADYFLKNQNFEPEKNFLQSRIALKKFDLDHLKVSNSLENLNLENQFLIDGITKFTNDWNNLL